uniref:M-phase phosphoprotein 6 n=1 Tax=Lygus hesperus TaxID=30085 RepID=A0A0A9ZIK7_LYGHE
MPKDRRGHAKLSKGVLEMKFMQRTKNRMRAEKEAEESRTMYEKDISKGMQNAVDKFIVEPSYVPIHNLIVGRVSYGGFNPEIEKFMTKPPVETEAVSREMEKEISDNEMTEFSSSLNNTMASKFNKNKKRKVAHFMKPED